MDFFAFVILGFVTVSLLVEITAISNQTYGVLLLVASLILVL